MSKERKQHKGLWDRIRGMFGDDAAHDRDLLDRSAREMRAEAQKMRRLAGQLYDASDDAYSAAWMEAWELLGHAADALEREADEAQREMGSMSDRRPVTTKAGGAHNIYKGH